MISGGSHQVCWRSVPAPLTCVMLFAKSVGTDLVQEVASHGKCLPSLVSSVVRGHLLVAQDDDSFVG